MGWDVFRPINRRLTAKTKGDDPAFTTWVHGKSLADWLRELEAPTSQERSDAKTALGQGGPVARILLWDCLTNEPGKPKRPHLFTHHLHPLGPHGAAWAAAWVWDDERAVELVKVYRSLLDGRIDFTAHDREREIVEGMLQRAVDVALERASSDSLREAVDMARELRAVVVDSRWPVEPGHESSWLRGFRRRFDRAMLVTGTPARRESSLGFVLLEAVEACRDKWHNVWRHLGTDAAEVVHPRGWIAGHAQTLRARMESAGRRLPPQHAGRRL